MSDDLLYALQLLQDRRRLYDTFRAYEAGNQPIMFATEKFRKFYATVMRRYRLNLCRAVVRQVARRISIGSWEGDDAADDWWNTAGLRLQNRIHREAVREGDAYTLTWPVDTMDGPLVTNRLRADEAIVVYGDDNPDMPAYGVKTWLTRHGNPRNPQWDLRANVYYRDRAERFVSGNVSTGTDSRGNPMQVNLDTLQPEPYEDDDADPVIGYEGRFGDEGLLPIQHLAVQPDDTPYGTSVLTDVVPVQDGLNKHAIDILVTSEQYGLPLRAAIGLEEVKDVDPDTGEQTSNLDIDYDPRLDYFMALPGEKSRLMQLPEADLAKLLEVKRASFSDASLVSNVPLMLLTEDSGEIPTGVALREVKAPLTELVEDIDQDLTIPWRNVARLYGWDASPQWAPAFHMDVLEQWELAQAKIDAGWPKRQAFIETGMDPKFVDEVLADAADREETVGAALVRAEREGRDPAELLQ